VDLPVPQQILRMLRTIYQTRWPGNDVISG
jgi:hypothetical protein